MLNLNELAQEISDDLEVNLGTTEEPKILTVKYRTNSVTPALEDKLFEVSQRSQVGSVYRLMLTEVLDSWDLEGTLPEIEGAQKSINDARTTPHILPVDKETLSLLPISMLEKIVRAIQENQSPKKATSTNSQGSFGTAAVRPYQPGTAA